MTSKGQYKTIVFVICSVAALGGLLFGLDQGFIANSLETLTEHYHLSVPQKESYSAVLATGGIVGALLSGVLARILGRKKSLLLAGFIFTAVSAYSALLPDLSILSACRFALGFAVGIASFVVPLYLSETAPAAIRGSMGTLFQLMITVGIFLISVSNVYIAHTVANSATALTLMFLTITLFAALMFLGGFILPESPRWLMLKGRREQAVAVLRRTVNTQAEIDQEIHEIEQALHGPQGAGIGIVLRGYFFKVLVVGVLLQMFQQLVGINVMIYYAPTIFGFASMKGIIAMMTVPTVNMLFTFPAISLVERWGRKKLLYVGALMMLISMVAAGLAFQAIGTHPDAAAIGHGPKTVLLLAVIVYIFGFAVSWGPVVWLVCSEIFPLEGREVGMTITTMVNWTFAGLLMANALTFMETFGNASIFYLFSGFCVLAIVFVALFVPETKGITLEQMEFNLRNGVPLRRLGQRPDPARG
ncbi:MAG: sugar porter family MFS transporter [Gammaproteobacteria bacterium]|nr:sugar porter family MFS transporter [Gammaproteobacteria bacterium]MBV9621429.1 sugar porter family MFS transporter [Gammaproteobacteria bacterium]